MKKTFWLFTPVAAVLALLLLAMASDIAGPPQSAQAGSQEDLWLSSADPPNGYTPAQLNPPDTATTSEQLGDNQLAPDGGVVSFRVAGSTLKPRNSGVTYTASGGGGCVYVTGGSASVVWNGPLGLPNGSVIDSMRVYYDDTDALNLSSWFTVYDLYGSIVQEWSAPSSGNSGTGFNDTPLIDHTVDYTFYSYAVNWRPNVTGSTMQLCGFRIFSTPPPFGLSFLPLSVK